MKIIIFNVNRKSTRAKQNMINMLTMYLHHINSFLGFYFAGASRINKSSYRISQDTIVIMYSNKMHRGRALSDIADKFGDSSKSIDENFSIIEYEDNNWNVENFIELVFGQKLYLLRQKIKHDEAKPKLSQTTKLPMLRSMRLLKDRHTWPYLYSLASDKMLNEHILSEMSIDELTVRYNHVKNANDILERKLSENTKELLSLSNKMNEFYKAN